LGEKMKKKQPITDADYILIVIGILIVCAMAPVIVWTAMITDDGVIPRAIISCEIIMLGTFFIITNLKLNSKIEANYRKCMGVIDEAPMVLSGSKGSRHPIISYEVKGKVYTIQSEVVYGGIAAFFLKGKEVAVYYDEDDPSIAYTKHYLFLIIGCMFLFPGLLVLCSIFYQ